MACDLDEIPPRLYHSLRATARRLMARERRGHTLQPTALVHEALLRLASRSAAWSDTRELRACAARAMRQVLVNHAKARQARRRGGGLIREDAGDLDVLVVRHDRRDVSVLDLEAALQELESLDPRQHQVVLLRYFGGLSRAEVAEHLAISVRTVQREWNMSQAWLRRRLSAGTRDG